MQEAVGDGTSDQWEKANVVTEADAQPGDLVFQKGPEAGSDNHVGILCGKTDAGDWIAVPPAILLPDTGTGSGNAEQQYSKHNNR